MLESMWCSQGICDSRGSMSKYMHSHVFIYFLIHLWKLETLLDVHACLCVLPAQNVERQAPSCEAGVACQCCPSGTDTRGASGPLNRLPGWAGSHTSRDRRGEREKHKKRKKSGGWGRNDIGQLATNAREIKTKLFTVVSLIIRKRENNKKKCNWGKKILYNIVLIALYFLSPFYLYSHSVVIHFFSLLTGKCLL